MSRDCATPKGKGKGKGEEGKGGYGKGDYGKGDYGKGDFSKGQGPYGKGPYKGFGKGDYGKGDSKGSKGKGKGFQGICWSCGKFGHSANNCRGIGEVQEGEQGGDQCSVEIGGVWDLCVVRSKTPVLSKKGWPKIADKNMFVDLQEEDEDEELLDNCFIGSAEIGIEPPPGLPNKGFERVPKKKWKRMCDWEKEECGDVCDLCPVETKDIKMKLRFEVADVKKPLIAVKRICEKGNRVCFGPKEEDNFIENKDSGDKILMRKNGLGSYLMDVSFENGMSTSITVDSGAQESVCPYEWGQQFGIRDPILWKNFSGANGSRIGHHGTRDVEVVTSTF